MAAMGYSHDRRDEMSTPLCGAHRPNKTNPLLIKPQLGCVKGTVYDLPSKADLQHEYGLRQERDGSSSAEVVGNWAQHDPNQKVAPGRDFKSLNKHAVVDGMTNCKGIREYRNTHDFRLKLGSDKAPEVKPYDASTSFGRPTNASTSFNDLFSHSYRYDWVAEATPAADAVAAKKSKKPTMTKTAMAQVEASRAKLHGEPPKSEWKMKAFTTVPAKIGKTG
jgi:hypothetical protein